MSSLKCDIWEDKKGAAMLDYYEYQLAASLLCAVHPYDLDIWVLYSIQVDVSEWFSPFFKCSVL